MTLKNITGHKLSPSSRAKLEGVHTDLVRIFLTCLYQISEEQDISVLCGVRTREEQAAHYASGASQTMDSKHLIQEDGTAHALDLGVWIPAIRGVSDDIEDYKALNLSMQQAALKLRLPFLTWGGDWTSFRDGPHFELPESYLKGV